MQYKTYTEGTYSLQGDKSTRLRVRTGQRNHYFVTDIELTENGFDGVENIGWKNLATESHLNTQSSFRDGSRTIDSVLCYVIDVELTATGFSGTQSVDWKCIYRKPKTDENILIIKWGDSISGAYGLNSDATANELAVKTRVKIWDNINNDGFDDLQIGVNNVLDHSGIVPPQTTSCNGWELELTNLVYNQNFVNTLYLVTTGQGGSSSDLWLNNSTIWQKFNTRVSGAIAAIGNAKPLKIYIVGSMGINNCIQGVSYVNAYPSDMTTIVSNMRGIVGNDAKIIICKIHTVGTIDPFNTYKETLNTDLLTLAGTLPNFYRIDTGLVDLVDAYHPSYAGNKIMADIMFGAVIDNFKNQNPIITT